MIAAITLGVYVAGIIITGMIFAFRNGAGLGRHDDGDAVVIAFIWPMAVVVVICASPFMLAHGAGELWRRRADRAAPTGDQP